MLTFFQGALLRCLSIRVDCLHVDPNRTLWRVRAAHNGEAESLGAVSFEEFGLTYRKTISASGQRAELTLLRVFSARLFFVHVGQLLFASAGRGLKWSKWNEENRLVGCFFSAYLKGSSVITETATAGTR